MKKDEKYKYFFWALVTALLVFAGLEIAISQFSTTAPAGGVSHSASEIVCNGCIDDSHINVISPEKIVGGNGFIAQGTLSVPVTGVAVADLSNSNTVGVADWTNKWAHTICSPSNPSDVEATSGVTSYIYTSDDYVESYNNKVHFIPDSSSGNILLLSSFGNGWSYIARYRTADWGAPGNVHSDINYYVRAKPGASDVLQLGITMEPGPGSTTSIQITCYVQYIGS
jgi:hypothetical protein